MTVGRTEREKGRRRDNGSREERESECGRKRRIASRGRFFQSKEAACRER